MESANIEAPESRSMSALSSWRLGESVSRVGAAAWLSFELYTYRVYVQDHFYMHYVDVVDVYVYICRCT